VVGILTSLYNFCATFDYWHPNNPNLVISWESTKILIGGKLDARAALDAIYEYVKAKDDAEQMADFDGGFNDHPKLESIASRFETILKS